MSEYDETTDQADETAAGTASVAVAAGHAEEEFDPAAELRQKLRFAPGDWYVVHSYAGYENKVKANLETRITSLDMEEYIFQVEVPTREEIEVKNGKRTQVQNKVFPGYLLVRMDLTPESYSCVRNTPGVTGFVGATSKPSPLTIDEVLKFLLGDDIVAVVEVVADVGDLRLVGLRLGLGLFGFGFVVCEVGHGHI